MLRGFVGGRDWRTVLFAADGEVAFVHRQDFLAGEKCNFADRSGEGLEGKVGQMGSLWGAEWTILILWGQGVGYWVMR